LEAVPLTMALHSAPCSRPKLSSSPSQPRAAAVRLSEIRVQKIDHINKLLNSEKMRTKQVTQEDAKRLGKKDALLQHLVEQTFQTGTVGKE
jgi:hypothetical protein